MAEHKAPSARGTITLHVKNMVCNRCNRVVREEVEKLGIDVRSVQLGEVVVGSRGLEKKLDRLRKVLEDNGFALIDDRKAQLVEQIKTAIIDFVHHSNGERSNRSYSSHIARTLGYTYQYLSKLFSSIENVTIEHFFILQRIERAKELIMYGELTLGEIAYELGYSGVQHLSNQFKQITGFTPTSFKRIKVGGRRSLDQVTQVRSNART